MKEKTLYSNTKPFLIVKDYMVSKEEYQLLFNSEYELLITHPVPKNLENYYKSDTYISHTDAKKSLFDKIYQAVKSINLKRKLKLINSFKTSSKKVLDIGAGTGDFLKTCANNGWNTFGVEPNISAINNAAKKGVFLQENISTFYKQKFDVITLWHVLEHVKNVQEYSTTLKKLVTKNGRLVVAVPNYKSYDANYYKQFWAGFDAPRHLWHFSKTAIKKLFSEIDMEVEKILPMKFDAYYVSLLSEKYKSKKMNPFAAFYRGFLSNLKARNTTEYSSLIYVIKNK